ncbi:unnamed protein product, partial [Owenia fusiformis]
IVKYNRNKTYMLASLWKILIIFLVSPMMIDNFGDSSGFVYPISNFTTAQTNNFSTVYPITNFTTMQNDNFSTIEMTSIGPLTTVNGAIPTVNAWRQALNENTTINKNNGTEPVNKMTTDELTTNIPTTIPFTTTEAPFDPNYFSVYDWPYIVIIINFLTTFLFYQCCKIATKLLMQNACFALPTLLMTPVCVTTLLLVQWRHPEMLKFNEVLFWNVPSDVWSPMFIFHFVSGLGLWWLSQ